MLAALRNKWPLFVLGAAGLAHLLMMGSLFWGYFDPLIFSSDRSSQAVDFFAIYEAGHRVLENRSMYEFAFVDPGAAAPYFSPYRYVPVFAYAVGAPLNVLAPWHSYWGWVALNELLLVLNAYATWRVAGKSSWRVVAASMWFVFTPFYLELYMGQFSFLMATALLWTGIGIVRQRELLAAVPWAVSLVIKSNSALIAPLFLRIGWWRTLAVAAGAVGLNAFYFLWRPSDFQLFLEQNLTDEFTRTALRLQYWPAQHGLTDFIENTYLAVETKALETPLAYVLIPVASVIAVSLATTFFARRIDPLVLFAIWSAAFFLVYNDVWEFHYVMLLPALVLLVAVRPSLRLVALATFVATALPTPYWLMNHVWNTGPIPDERFLLQNAWPAWGVIFVHGAKPIPVALFWMYLVFSQARHGLTLDWVLEIRMPWKRATIHEAQD